MKKVLVALLCSACGGGGNDVTVDLVASTVPGLNPYDPATGISKIRIEIDGPDQHDDAIRDLSLGQTQAVFEKFPAGQEVEIRAQGFDVFGNVVAFGRVDQLLIEGDVSVTIPFRRNLAYVIHQHDDRQMEPASHVYLLDMTSRTLVQKIRLPGTSPRARGISARGGESILVTYDDGAAAFVGVLSAETNQVEALPLMKSQTLAIASANSPMAVVAGGGSISFLNLETGQNDLHGAPVGGRVLDAAISPDGSRAIVVLDTAALDIDIVNREVKQLAILPDPAGVAIGFGGKVAYLTSKSEGTVVQINLLSGEANAIPGAGFVRPVVGATFSEEMQAVFGVHVAESGSARVIAFIVFPEQLGLSLEEGTLALESPAGIAADGPGRRIISVSAGTSSATAGLTMIDTFPDQNPDGSSTLYPLDPDDTYLSPGGTLLRQRWRPGGPVGVAVIYGR